jgi:excisionase family DNA binding protein
VPRRRSPIALPPLSDPRDLSAQRAMRGGSDLFAPAWTDETGRPREPAFLTIGEVAVRLRMSEKSIRRRIEDGVIRVAPTGGRLVRISSDELLRLTAGGPLEEP